MKENFKSLQENTNNIKTTIDTQKTYSAAIKEQLQELKKNVSAIQTTVTDIQSEATRPPLLVPNSQSHTMSYAEMATRPSLFADPHHADVIAKAKIADQCVIMKPTTETTMSTTAKSTEKELVTDINKALSLAVTTVDDDLIIVPEEHRVVGSRKLTSGGVMYIFNSDEAAAWLREPGAERLVNQATGEDTIVCLQLNNIIVPFAPTTIDVKNMETWRGIEDSSGLRSGTIRSVKFLKPMEFHHEGQQEAHLIIGFDSRIQANRAIQHGIIIEGKELYASKELPDAS
ncbi:hypothetical protein EV421DRAFT_1899467 [Armillaria borealis]|uniref:Uncharacterized protein n=1 Tax=Armillaria borealis TaxID=47425 RepID=A0AA39JWK6_9AGAR|nr:hypothetical protein EV421DRAFT_1899467 [Armillaria borealis]